MSGKIKLFSQNHMATFFKDERKEVREFIQNKISDTDDWCHSGTTNISNSAHDAMYQDTDDIDFSYQNGKRELPHIEFSPSICLNCGNENTENAYQGLCSECNNCCTACGESIIGAEFFDNDGNVYCENCFESKFSFCDDCEEYHNNDSITWVESVTRYVCESCLDNYTYCKSCREYYDNVNVTCIDGDNYCDVCRDYAFEECGECGEWIEIDDSYNYNYDSYCESCFNNSYAQCEDCGETFEKSKLNDDNLCENCIEIPEIVISKRKRGIRNRLSTRCDRVEINIAA